MTVSISRAGEGGEEGDITCYVCNQIQDEEGRKLNQKNIFFVRSHLSKCLYNAGKLFQSVPPGRANTAPDGRPVDELGNKSNSWYNCEVEGCWLAQKKGSAGQVCYKVFAIHMASQHGALEMVLLEEGEPARELVEQLLAGQEDRRPATGAVKQEAASQPEVTMEEATGCFQPVSQPPAIGPLTTLDALNTLFHDLQSDTTAPVPPAPTLPAPAPPALRRPAPPSGPKRPAPPPLQSATLLNTTELMHCRFSKCIQATSGAGGNTREMKLHYAGRHFQRWFPVDPATKLPPGFTRTGNRAVCNKCTETAGKPVYVQSEENAVRGHLVVKHDSLGEVLLQAQEVPETREVIGDLYPELLEWTAGP
jgi:hypothetical protein